MNRKYILAEMDEYGTEITTHIQMMGLSQVIYCIVSLIIHLSEELGFSKEEILKMIGDKLNG